MHTPPLPLPVRLVIPLKIFYDINFLHKQSVNPSCESFSAAFILKLIFYLKKQRRKSYEQDNYTADFLWRGLLP